MPCSSTRCPDRSSYISLSPTWLVSSEWAPAHVAQTAHVGCAPSPMSMARAMIVLSKKENIDKEEGGGGGGGHVSSFRVGRALKCRSGGGVV